jgi:hypothetical protein
MPAQAQSLALTYKLEARSDTGQHAPGAVNRCAGFNWMTSIGACGRELLTRISQPVTADGLYSGGAVFEPAEVAGVPDLPSPGALALEPRLRSAGGSTRMPDVLFRLGSRYRANSNDDAYKFTDANYESHVHNNGHKAVRVELLVPFQ